MISNWSRTMKSIESNTLEKKDIFRACVNLNKGIALEMEEGLFSA